MNVLIFGCGYVGWPLAVQLARQGHAVSCVNRTGHAPAPAVPENVRVIAADVTNPTTFSRLPAAVDAAVYCVSSSRGSVEDYRAVYLEGVRNVLAWRGTQNLRHFVYTSSTSVYGQIAGEAVTEESPAEPQTETARILRQTEDLLLDARTRNKVPATILRVAGIYGPGRGYWLKQFLSGETVIDGDGSRYLNMIHRDDLVRILRQCLEKKLPHAIYNACDSEPVTQLDLFSWLAKRLNRPRPPSAERPETTSAKRGFTNKRVSNARLVSDLAYCFRYPTFREGFAAELEQASPR